MKNLQHLLNFVFLLTVTLEVDCQDIRNYLSGQEIEILSVEIKCNEQANGFLFGDGNYGKKGLFVLSTGKIFDFLEERKSQMFDVGSNNFFGGSELLSKYLDRVTNDECLLKIQFTSNASSVMLSYQFLEELKHEHFALLNDAYGIFYKRVDETNYIKLALDTINISESIKFEVNPREKYELLITLADLEDQIFDSYILLPKGALSSAAISSAAKSGNSNNQSLKLLPNPVQNFLTVEILSEIQESTFIALNDLNGNIVLKTELKLEKGENSVVLDLSSLNSGVYFVNSKSKSQILSQLFVKE